MPEYRKDLSKSPTSVKVMAVLAWILIPPILVGAILSMFLHTAVAIILAILAGFLWFGMTAEFK